MSAKKIPDPSALRSALKERMIQQQRATRSHHREKLLAVSRREDECFALQCVGSEFGLNTENAQVMDSLWLLEEEIRAELQYQAWYAAEAQSVSGTLSHFGGSTAQPAATQPPMSSAPSEIADAEWEHYYSTLAGYST